MAAPKTFISHSHEDEAWKARLVTQLRVLERHGVATFWDTSELPVGVEETRLSPHA
jgi:hypothetical protein